MQVPAGEQISNPCAACRIGVCTRAVPYGRSGGVSKAFLSLSFFVLVLGVAPDGNGPAFWQACVLVLYTIVSVVEVVAAASLFAWRRRRQQQPIFAILVCG